MAGGHRLFVTRLLCVLKVLGFTVRAEELGSGVTECRTQGLGLRVYGFISRAVQDALFL